MPDMGNSPSRRSQRLATRMQRDQEPEPVGADEDDVSDVEFVIEDEDEDEDMVEDDSEMETDDDEEESGIGEVHPHVTAQLIMRLQQFRGGYYGTRGRRQRTALLDQYGPVPDDPPAMQNDLSVTLCRSTSCCDPRYPCSPAKEEKMLTTDAGTKTRNVASFLLQRQLNTCGDMNSWNEPQRRHLCCHFLPNKPLALKDQMTGRAYIGQYSHQGDYFIAAFQAEKRVRIYETEHDWRIKKDVYARNLRWTITDTTLSKDQQFLVYASITPTLNMVNVTTGGVDSQANVTEVHEAMHLDEVESNGQPEGHSRLCNFGVFSVKWAADARSLCAGTGGNLANVLFFDVQKGKTVLSIEAHDNDVNAVAFMDESSNVIASGSDDHLIKVWDKRAPQAVAGILVGHTQGLTYLDPKGDGRYLLSNSKDQSAKIWDIRKMMSRRKFRARKPSSNPPQFGWDYRAEDYPGRGCNIRHDDDCSVQTLFGHSVSSTLIRAYWSPMHSTGQRFVYTGSADGHIHIFDAVTAKIAQRLTYHSVESRREIIRDVSWHPHQASIVSAGFDGSLIEFGYSTRKLEEHIADLPPTGSDNYYW